MTKKLDTGSRLTELLARAEHAADRNRAQRATIVKTANRMADHASTFIASVEDRAAAGDADAIRQLRRAGRGRTRARRLAAS